MSLNVPSGQKKNLSFGPGILLVTTDILATPNVDIGYVNGSSFQINTQKLEVKQGSPKTLVATFGLETEVSLQVEGIEWNLANLRYVLGSGSLSASNSVLSFGGVTDFVELACLFRHKTPTGGTVEIRLWRTQGEGTINLQFNDNLQAFPFNFKALEADQQWGGGTLSSDVSKGQIVFQRAA
jgi:hypothetical protein